MSECKMCGKLNPTTDCYSCLIEHFENHVEDLKKERDALKARVEELERENIRVRSELLYYTNRGN